MSADRELLEAAAKAAGLRLFGWNDAHEAFNLAKSSNPVRWNPLTDDGDALRLAVNLGIDPDVQGEAALALLYGEDRCTRVRRAITRAAADIGRALDGEGKT